MKLFVFVSSLIAALCAVGVHTFPVFVVPNFFDEPFLGESTVELPNDEEIIVDKRDFETLPDIDILQSDYARGLRKFVPEELVEKRDSEILGDMGILQSDYSRDFRKFVPTEKRSLSDLGMSDVISDPLYEPSLGSNWNVLKQKKHSDFGFGKRSLSDLNMSGKRDSELFEDLYLPEEVANSHLRDDRKPIVIPRPTTTPTPPSSASTTTPKSSQPHKRGQKEVPNFLFNHNDQRFAMG